MKKLSYFFTAFLLLLTLNVAPVAAHFITGKATPASEPQPHPNTIYVKMKLNGNTVLYSFLVFPSDTVGEVKSTVSEWTGIPEEDFALYYNGLELDESLTLSFYGIAQGATLSLRWL